MSRLALVAAGLLLAMAGCGEATGAEVHAPPSPDVVVAAEQMAFEPGELRVPAGRPLTVLFRNRDAALHNVAIFAELGGDAVFVGEFIGTGEVLYSVPPLEPGRYLLRCDLHPSMTGVVVVS